MADEKKENKGGCCKSVIQFLASVGGLSFVLAGYIVGGAYAFIYFESKLEEEERLVGKYSVRFVLSYYLSG